MSNACKEIKFLKKLVSERDCQIREFQDKEKENALIVKQASCRKM